MGTRGRIPKNNPRRRNKRDIKGVIPSSAPGMPDGLAGEALAEWERVVPIVDNMGILSALDRGVLLRYCRAHADWIELDEQIRATGNLIRGSKGELIQSPFWVLRRQASQECLNLGIQLGLTPAARLRSGIRHEPAATATEGVTAIEDYRQRLGG